MKLGTLFVISAVIAAIYGAAVLAVPKPFLELYGLVMDPSAVAMAQLVGVLLLGFAVANYLARGMEPALARPLVLGNFVTDALGTVVIAYNTVIGVVNTLSWSTVAIYGLFAVGWGYFAFVAKPSA